MAVAVASAADADARGKLEKLRDEKGRRSSLSFLPTVMHAIRNTAPYVSVFGAKLYYLFTNFPFLWLE